MKRYFKLCGLLLAALLIQFGMTGLAQAQTVLRVTPTNLTKLQTASNYKSTPGETSSYYRISTSPTLALPNQSSVMWTAPNGTTVYDMTRSGGQGQCTNLIWNVTQTETSTAKWQPKQSVVGADGRLISLEAGMVLAIFNSTGTYANQHTMIVLQRINDTTLEVIDQNWITGLNVAKVVGKHTIKITKSGSVSDLQRYSVVQLKP
jgi:hypothetical protein